MPEEIKETEETKEIQGKEEPELIENTSEDLAQYFSEINKFNQSIDIKNVRAAYDTIHKVMK